VLSTAAVLPAAALSCLHMFQLESYQLPGYYRYLRDHGHSVWKSTILFAVILSVATAAVSILAGFLPGAFWNLPLAWLVSLAACLIRVRMTLSAPAKKPIAFTARMKRLIAGTAVLGLVLSAVVGSMVAVLPGFIAGWISALLVAGLAPIWTVAAAQLMAPVEKRINQWYLDDAARILREHKPMIKIGITGSYGKTSSKMMLQTILSERFLTQCTPASYNTPMGVTRFVRESLKEDTQVFLAEMGARHVGDIQELCDLVHPDHGLLVSVGPQHLETFFTIENVASTKYELAKSLPDTGVAFFPMDDGEAEKLYRRHKGQKISFGFEREGVTPDFYAKDMECSYEGLHFTLVDARTAEEVRCVSSLLGRHNISNLLGAAAVARTLGMKMEEIARGIEKVAPVEHRLQLIRGNGGVTVIDDAFNSNPAGAKAAMEVLASFPGRHIVVTPGLVEQGEEEYARNREFGSQMAKAADIAILVAGNREAMRQGLLDEGYSIQRILETETLTEASALLATITRAGDVVLFENDLPDQYEAK